MIYSQAAYNSPEVQQSRTHTAEYRGKHHYAMNYFEFLGEVSKYFYTIGIAGTNGKSSTTALTIFAGEKLLPTFGLGIVGAILPW